MCFLFGAFFWPQKVLCRLTFDDLFSLNSLSVRVPHNSSKTSVATSDPESVAPAWLPGCPAWFSYKTTFFKRFRLLDLQSQCFFKDFGCPIYKTNVFLTDFGCPIYKTNVCLTLFSTNAVKPICF